MSDKEIKVPNIGEFKDVEVIEVLVLNGQSVSKNDPLITIESDKSSVEIPASIDGNVKSVSVKVGDKVSEGDTILILENSEEITEDIKNMEINKVEEPTIVTELPQQEEEQEIEIVEEVVKKKKKPKKKIIRRYIEPSSSEDEQEIIEEFIKKKSKPKSKLSPRYEPYAREEQPTPIQLTPPTLNLFCY